MTSRKSSDSGNQLKRRPTPFVLVGVGKPIAASRALMNDHSRPDTILECEDNIGLHDNNEQHRLAPSPANTTGYITKTASQQISQIFHEEEEDELNDHENVEKYRESKTIHVPVQTSTTEATAQLRRKDCEQLCNLQLALQWIENSTTDNERIIKDGLIYRSHGQTQHFQQFRPMIRNKACSEMNFVGTGGKSKRLAVLNSSKNQYNRIVNLSHSLDYSVRTSRFNGVVCPAYTNTVNSKSSRTTKAKRCSSYSLDDPKNQVHKFYNQSLVSCDREKSEHKFSGRERRRVEENESQSERRLFLADWNRHKAIHLRQRFKLCENSSFTYNNDHSKMTVINKKNELSKPKFSATKLSNQETYKVRGVVHSNDLNQVQVKKCELCLSRSTFAPESYTSYCSGFKSSQSQPTLSNTNFNHRLTCRPFSTSESKVKLYTSTNTLYSLSLDVNKKEIDRKRSIRVDHQSARLKDKKTSSLGLNDGLSKHNDIVEESIIDLQIECETSKNCSSRTNTASFSLCTASPQNYPRPARNNYSYKQLEYKAKAEREKDIQNNEFISNYQTHNQNNADYDPLSAFTDGNYAETEDKKTENTSQFISQQTDQQQSLTDRHNKVNNQQRPILYSASASEELIYMTELNKHIQRRSSSIDSVNSRPGSDLLDVPQFMIQARDRSPSTSTIDESDSPCMSPTSPIFCLSTDCGDLQQQVVHRLSDTVQLPCPTPCQTPDIQESVSQPLLTTSDQCLAPQVSLTTEEGDDFAVWFGRRGSIFIEEKSGSQGQQVNEGTLTRKTHNGQVSLNVPNNMNTYSHQ